MKKNKTFVLASTILLLGIVTLLGTSYSLITNSLVTDDGYSFDVANFAVEFQDNTKITLNGLPTSDEDGLKNSKEFTFTVSNTSNFDVNYRLDILENSTIPMSEVIRYNYKLNNEENNNVYLLKDNYTIKQNRVLKANDKDTYKVKIWLSIDADETYMNKRFSATISLMATHNQNKYATNVLEYLSDNHLDGVMKDNDNYRYVGEDASNYVWFNCQDNYTKGADYCEKWRIIGSFPNTYEDSLEQYASIKLIRNNAYETLSFNNDDMKGDYNESYINTYANGYFYDKLSDKTKSLILKAKWNIGSTDKNYYNGAVLDEKEKIYYTNVGLINTSDFLFIRDKSWIKYDGVIMSLNKDMDNVNGIQKEILKKEGKDELLFVPCVYLKPDVSIIRGLGTEDNPYELDIKYPFSYGIVR